MHARAGCRCTFMGQVQFTTWMSHNDKIVPSQSDVAQDHVNLLPDYGGHCVRA